MTYFGLDQVTQALMGLSHLSLIREPYKYPFMELRFPYDFS